jgi:RHS repeat-associated protein
VTAAGKTTTYGYDANSNLTTQTNPHGTTVTQTFNADDELTSLVNKKSDATVLSQFSYTYNSDGLRSQVNEMLGSQTATVSYTYDALHRLKDEVRTGADASENHFTYDAAGNRLTWNDGVGTTTYTYDAADRLTQEGNTTYTYNANGSRVSKTLSGSTTTYSYDYDEQLTQVVSPLTGTSSFTYDESGRRVTRTAGSTTTTFHFSGSSITTEKQGANVTAHYVYGVNRVSRDASGSYEYYHSDGIGSTRQLSNDTQTITQTTTYDAFGNVESSAGSSSNAYKYAGQWGYRNDGDDGLMHVGARYYDALVGRFISADTYLGEVGNPQSLNLYIYVENDPVNYVDPTGHAKGGSSLQIELQLGRAIAEKNVEGVGTIIEALTDEATAKVVEQVMRGTLKQLPARMKTSEGALRGVRGYAKQIIGHAEKIAKNPNSPSRNHWLKEIKTFIQNAGKDLKF